MKLQADYAERVYAGVLGKIIGVYLGRPFEGWSYRDILKKLGPIDYYVHENLNVPLIVTDDDITGTFTFARTLSDDPSLGADMPAERVGRNWLNYIIENKTILWWGGVGMSTEHTAFKRLKDGMPAPRSGSMATNGQVVAEQIGSQIFIDGWAMVAPGRPDLAAELAKQAASVSHDGEAVYAAQVVAAMEAQAFVEPSLDKLLDVGVSFIPKDSVIARMIADLRDFGAKESDWNKAMTDVMEKSFGYDKYGGNCHVVPNHGLIILALLYGQDSFQKSLMIANTCGWDTDCNSGNVGCLLGIKNGLVGIDSGPDWRGPVADRLYLPTAEGGSCITDALTEAYRLIQVGHRLAGEDFTAPKESARYHFSLPGSVQGFKAAPEGDLQIANERGRLVIRCESSLESKTHRISTATFIPPGTHFTGSYALLASPTLSPGQRVSAKAMAARSNPSPMRVNLFASYYGEHDAIQNLAGEVVELRPGESVDLSWTLPTTGGQPIFEIGLEFVPAVGERATIHLDRLTWTGSPNIRLGRPNPTGEMWKRQWVDAVSTFSNGARTNRESQAFTLIQNTGRGIAIHGTRDWRDYTVSASVTPHLARAVGIAARVQGLKRYYALLLTNIDGLSKAQLIKMLDREQILAESAFTWNWDSVSSYALSLRVHGKQIQASIDGNPLFSITDAKSAISSGGIGLIVEEGRVNFSPVTVL